MRGLTMPSPARPASRRCAGSSDILPPSIAWADGYSIVAVPHGEPDPYCREGPPRGRRCPQEELEAVGALPLRAPMGDGEGGLFRGRRRLGLFHPRGREVAGL